jgi:hypothetical protein
MPVVQAGAICAASAHDRADDAARDHATRSTFAMSLWPTELLSPSSQAMVTSLQDVPTTVPSSLAEGPQQTRSPGLRLLDWSPVILFLA